MNPEDAVTIRIGGTIKSRWFAALAVMRIFRVHFAVATIAWIALGEVLFDEAVFFAESALIAVAVFLLVNAAGVDPGQLLVSGEITFTPTRVYQKRPWGTTRERGWAWVRSAQEVAGRLHLVLGAMRSRAITPPQLTRHADYGLLRAMLIAQGKLVLAPRD